MVRSESQFFLFSSGLRERVRALLGERSEVEQRAKDLAHTVATQKVYIHMCTQLALF